MYYDSEIEKMQKSISSKKNQQISALAENDTVKYDELGKEIHDLESNIKLREKVVVEKSNKEDKARENNRKNKIEERRARAEREIHALDVSNEIEEIFIDYRKDKKVSYKNLLKKVSTVLKHKNPFELSKYSWSISFELDKNGICKIDYSYSNRDSSSFSIEASDISSVNAFTKSIKVISNSYSPEIEPWTTITEDMDYYPGWCIIEDLFRALGSGLYYKKDE